MTSDDFGVIKLGKLDFYLAENHGEETSGVYALRWFLT